MKAAADAFAANVLPVIERIKAEGPTSFNAIAEGIERTGR